MTFSSHFHLIEPHPSASPSNVYGSGRGGAGNHARIDPSLVTKGSDATGPASRTKLALPPSNARSFTGRGGAGNVRRSGERAIFSFDEELEAQQRLQDEPAPVYHVGRGGAGNAVNEMKPRASRFGSGSSTDSTSSNDSASSATSAKLRNVKDKLSRRFSSKNSNSVYGAGEQ